MRITGINVRRVGEGQSAGAWASALAAPPEGWQARKLKEEDGSWVRRAVLGEPAREVIVKCRQVWRMGDRFKRWFRWTRGDRHWHGAEWLMANGFATPRPLVLADAVVDGVACEVLVTEYLEGRSVLEHLAAGDLGVREEHEVCRALARLIAGLLARGRYNRDGKPSNLLIKRGAGGELSVVTIDSVAIRRTGPSGYAKLTKMLADLVIEPIGVGVLPRRALRGRVGHEVACLLRQCGNIGGPGDRRVHLAAFKLWWHVAERVERHGDPRPRVSPLVESAGRGEGSGPPVPSPSSAQGAGARLAAVPGAEAPGDVRAP